MDGIPVVIFDTSAINHLSKEQHCKGLVAALRHGFYTRVLATNFEEVAATVRSEERRSLLLSVSRSLLAGGDCILPFNWLLEGHIEEFEKDPAYDWQKIAVCTSQCGSARECSPALSSGRRTSAYFARSNARKSASGPKCRPLASGRPTLSRHD